MPGNLSKFFSGSGSLAVVIGYNKKKEHRTMTLITSHAELVSNYKTATPYDILNVALLSNNLVCLPYNLFGSAGEYVRRVAGDGVKINVPYSSRFPVEVIVTNRESIQKRIADYVALCEKYGL